MNILLVTQKDPFYLAENMEYLIEKIPFDIKIIGCLLLEVSPFGKRETFFKKTMKTLKVFGIKFFGYYAFNYIKNIFNSSKSVKNVLKKYKIPTMRLENSINSEQSLKIIKSFHPDLIISIAGNQIFKEKLINLPSKGTINLHTAPLPKYRGLMPTFWVMKNNERYTGVSVFFMNEGIDSGPIIVQKKIEIHPEWSQKQLIEFTKKLGMDAIIESIDKIKRNNYTLISNRDSEMTYFKFPTRRDVKQFYAMGKKFF